MSKFPDSHLYQLPESGIEKTRQFESLKQEIQYWEIIFTIKRLVYISQMVNTHSFQAHMDQL